MRRTLFILLVGALTWVGACAKTNDEKIGQLMLTLQTDMSIPKDIDSVRIEVRSYGMLQFASDFDLGPGGLKLPATLGVVAGKDPSAPVNIRVVAYQNKVARVLREVITTVPSDRVATLPVPLHWLCADARSVKTDPKGEVVSACPDEQTCVAGSCDTSTVESTKLSEYSEASVFGGGTAAGDGKCFDLAGCFNTAFPLNAMQPGCKLGIPPGQDTSLMNFGLRSGKDGAGTCNQDSCVVPLDFGPTDGWRVQGSEIVFPKAVCDVMSLGVSLVGTQGCPSKLASIPNCGVGSSVSGDIVGIAGLPTAQPTTPPTTNPTGMQGTGGAPAMPIINQEQILASGFQSLGAIAVNQYGVFWIGERGGQSGVFRCGFDGCGMNPVSVFLVSGKVLAMTFTSNLLVLSVAPAAGSGSQILSCPLPDGCSPQTPAKVIAVSQEALRLLAASETEIYWRDPTRFLKCPIGMQCDVAPFLFAAEPQLVADMKYSEGRVFWTEPMTGEIRYCMTPDCSGGPQGLASQLVLPSRLAVGGGHVYWIGESKRVLDCPIQSCGGGGLSIYEQASISALSVDAVDVYAADEPRPNTWEIVKIVRSQPPSAPVTVWSGPSATVDMAMDTSRIYFTSQDGNVRRTLRPFIAP